MPKTQIYSDIRKASTYFAQHKSNQLKCNSNTLHINNQLENITSHDGQEIVTDQG